MPMAIRFLPTHHLLLRENAEDGAADFDDDGTVLALIDDHARAASTPEPHIIAIPLPKDDGLLRDLERWVPRIREHSLSDAYEAMMEVLAGEGYFAVVGKGKYRGKRLIDAVRADRQYFERYLLGLASSPPVSGDPWCAEGTRVVVSAALGLRAAQPIPRAT